MGLFSIGESKREKVKKIRAGERKRSLKFRREERGRKARERELEGETRLLKAKAKRYRAEAEMKAEKRTAKPWMYFDAGLGLPKKKKQGRKLSKKRRISLI